MPTCNIYSNDQQICNSYYPSQGKYMQQKSLTLAVSMPHIRMTEPPGKKHEQNVVTNQNTVLQYASLDGKDMGLYMLILPYMVNGASKQPIMQNSIKA